MTYIDRRLYAHRGMSALVPENTLSAFKKCADYGVQWFECDVDVIADGTVIVCHDSSLDRTTNRSGSYYGLVQDDLKNIDAGSWFSDDYKGEKLPTLSEVIDLMNELELNANIELKGCEAGKEYANRLIDNVIEQIARLDDARKVIVSSFNHLLLAKFKEKAPHITVACLWDANTVSADWYTTMQIVGADYVHIEDKFVTAEIVKLVKSKGFGINVWTVNDLARANQLFNWGIDGIFTDIAHTFPKPYLDF